MPSIWTMLQLFWTREKIDAWKSQIFRDRNNPEKQMDGPWNVISLNVLMHDDWTHGVFALRPLSYTDTKLTMEFNYLPDVNHRHFDQVPLTQRPKDTRETFTPYGMTCPSGSTPTFLSHGDIVEMTTDNPSTHPLPSYELLDMHWRLNKIVALSAAADVSPEESDEDDDNVPPVAAYFGPGLPRWVEDVPSSSWHDQGSSQATSQPSSPSKAQQAAHSAQAEAPEENL